MFKCLRNTPCWKNTMKLCLIYSAFGIFTFWFLIFVIIVNLSTNINIDISFYRWFIFVFQSVFISCSLTVFVLNSTENQQKKYRFLWLFLFLLAINPFGFISIIMLMKKQKKENNTIIEIQENPIMIKNEKWFLLWAMYSSIGMMIFIITIPISIINLINIKRNWKNEFIDIKEIEKIVYFSSDLTLMLASKFAF